MRNQHEFPRHFLAQELDLGDWQQLAPYFEDLRSRDLSTAEQLKKWLEDLSELQAAISEENSVRYISMTCHTDNPQLEQAYLHYIEQILPKTEPEYFALDKKYLECPVRDALPKERFFVYDRARANEVEIFREENVALQTQDEVLAQQYQKICGEMTAQFEGKEQTIPQLMRYLEQTQRELRHSAWLVAIDRQLSDRQALEDIFDKMIAIRQQVAENAGMENYLEYQFRHLGRFDYTPEDCARFHDSVEKLVVPLRRKLREQRRSKLGLDRLAPWDLEVDPLGRPPLRPFETAPQLIEGADRIFRAVSPEFSQKFAVLRENGLLDLESRKGKAPGGYQSELDEARLPFIFMNATGRNNDVFTLLHEGGHAFHALESRREPLHAYRHAPIEFCEVASMGMEMMASERLETFYDAPSAQRARQMHLEDVIVLLPWIARIDAFQHWIYTHPRHSRQERQDKWLELDERFGDPLDWSQKPEWRDCSWIRQLHLFCVPLYYIEYGIAQLGALQLWMRFRQDGKSAVEGYLSALALGGSHPLPELFGAAGIRFAFDGQTIEPLVRQVEQSLSE